MAHIVKLLDDLEFRTPAEFGIRDEVRTRPMLLRPVTCTSRPSPGSANSSDIGILSRWLTCWSLS